MVLTEKQEQGLKIAVERYNNHEPYTVIAGYAGVGKSTLIKFIIAALRLDPEYVAYISYTGKAAQVLRNKGCPNSMTAHRLLYNSRVNKDGNYIHIPKNNLYPYKLIVVDEISMLPKRMWDLLLSYKVHVLALGDPGQLPPVGDEKNDALNHPNIFLDEVMRQAAENEIIRLTMDIRAGKELKYFRGETVRIVDRSEILKPKFFFWADQVIVGKNDTRNFVNHSMRRQFWADRYEDEPLAGDKVICLHNDWDCVNETNDALVNGMTGHIASLWYTNDNPFMEKTPKIDFQPEIENTAPFYSLEIDYKLLMEHTPLVTRGPQGTWKHIPKSYQPQEFDYGYAVTCHKAQGSEFNKVIVLEEYFMSASREDHIKWLYTAATRAAQKLIIVKNYHR